MYFYYCIFKKINYLEMINCANQIRRVEMLRESLEQSLKNCAKFNNNDNFIPESQNYFAENGENSSYSFFSASNNNNKGIRYRPLCLLFCSDTSAVIQISVI